MRDTREKILIEASILFTRRGYFGTSTRDIARSVGIRQPSLFHHFATKLEIMEELLKYDLQWAVQIAEKWAAAPLPAAERLYGYIHEDMQHLIQSPYSIQGLYGDEVMEDPSFARWRSLRSRLRKAVRTMIRDGIQSSEFVVIDPIFLERVISWFLLGTHRMFNRTPLAEGIEPDWKPNPQLLEAAVGIMLRGILTDSSRVAALSDPESANRAAGLATPSVNDLDVRDSW
jgi:AcrR family transcriptional regulator